MRVPTPSPWREVGAGSVVCSKCYDRTRTRMRSAHTAPSSSARGTQIPGAICETAASSNSSSRSSYSSAQVQAPTPPVALPGETGGPTCGLMLRLSRSCQTSSCQGSPWRGPDSKSMMLQVGPLARLTSRLTSAMEPVDGNATACIREEEGVDGADGSASPSILSEAFSSPAGLPALHSLVAAPKAKNSAAERLEAIRRRISAREAQDALGRKSRAVEYVST